MASEDLLIKHAMGEGGAAEAPPPQEIPVIRPPAEEPMAETLPVLPLGDLVVFPGMVAPLVINTQRSTKLIDDVVAGGRYLIGALQRNRTQSDDQVDLAGLFPEATVLRLLKMLKFPDDTVRVLVQGHARCLVGEGAAGAAYLRAHYKLRPDDKEDSMEVRALLRNAAQRFQEVITLSPTLPDELKIAVVNTDDPGPLSDLIAANLNLSLEDRQALLAETSPKSRLKRVTLLLNREREVLRLGAQIQSQVSETFGKNQREFFLREQMKAIKKELGESDPQQVELKELEEKLAKAGLPAEVQKVAARERERLANIPVASPEYAVARTYLEILADLPWQVRTEDNLDIARARRVLDEDHYDLKKVKDRILEFLAVLKLKKDLKGPILCFLGPPGVGKTSLGQSIARALGRKFIRMSLGGVRDEAEIRGHRRTYIGSMPGRVIQNLRKAGSRNPVFMLDEIDKLGADFRGDPSAALLEVLDPAQNGTFTDHYLDVPFDLSSVLFIATANIADPMPPALRDRMEIIELPGYTALEKMHIARRHLLPRQLADHGLKKGQVDFTDAALQELLSAYTREAGVRNLDRQIANICRKVARRTAEGRRDSIVVEPKALSSMLGPRVFDNEVAEKNVTPGVVTGLAWTPTGGDILFIEATRMPGKGSLILTGSLGDVMKESAMAALSLVRSHAERWKVGIDFEKTDFHVHVPAGAVPKDGPSAGVAMLVALYSLVTQRILPPDTALTGEITLRGKVMPVGGIKEKVLAASRAGIRRILLPADNRRHLQEVPAEVRKNIRFAFVRKVEDVLKALDAGRKG